MHITIEYESSWRNSFLAGDNYSPLPKKGREFIGSMTSLKKRGENNFIKREITFDTIMGLLNRLIGDQRKLYQAREKQFSQMYYFEEIEKKGLISFHDSSLLSHEVVYIRNMEGSNDRNSFSGILKVSDPMFTSDYSKELWGVLELSFEQLCYFIMGQDITISCKELDPRYICELFTMISAEKFVLNEGTVQQVLVNLEKYFPSENYLTAKGLVVPSMLYCSALYIQLKRLEKKYDMSSAKTKSGVIVGISKRSFTKKDFMKRFTSGNGKKIWGNPYLKKERIKGEGEVTSMLTKASGQLEITINVNKEQGSEIARLIEYAGVSSFYVGKKGLGYVTKISP